MRRHGLHQAPAQPAGAVFLNHEHVAQPGEGCVVGDDPGKADLPAVGGEDPEAQ
jgi:hypothetical protein